jgi:putative AdoMet-dependent methyltransferase
MSITSAEMIPQKTGFSKPQFFSVISIVGLRRAVEMLKPGGKFYLFDVVFPAAMTDHENQFDDWVQSTADEIGPDFAPEVESTIRDEFVTCDWIMEGLLHHAGFQIDSIQYGDGFGANYICIKP